MFGRMLRQLQDVVSQVAEDKQRAAEARFRPADTEVPAPSEVYAEACSRIAEALSQAGFTYAPSGPHLTRLRGDWKDVISFQTSRDNVRGQRVALWVHAKLQNKRLNRWRQENASPFVEGDSLAGGHIGNLKEPKGWCDWDLADAATRDQVIAEVVTEIERIILPWFDRFRDVDALCRELLQADVPGLGPIAALELELCCLGSDAAEHYLKEWLRRHPESAEQFREHLSQVRAAGEPAVYDDVLTQPLAVAVVHHGLQVRQP
jgi:hypothetical protein